MTDARYAEMWEKLNLDLPAHDALLDRYLRIDCACFTPNTEVFHGPYLCRS